MLGWTVEMPSPHPRIGLVLFSGQTSLAPADGTWQTPVGISILPVRRWLARVYLNADKSVLLSTWLARLILTRHPWLIIISSVKANSEFHVTQANYQKQPFASDSKVLACIRYPICRYNPGEAIG